jgi:hypothetical protein
MISKETIKKIIPISIQKKRWEYQAKIRENKENVPLKRKIIKYLKDNVIEDDMKEVYNFLKKNPFSIFPYNFIKKYKHNAIMVYTDDDCDMKYVLHDGKRLYFKSELNKNEIKTQYNGLQLEQDIDSPHRYEYGNFKVENGDIVVDIGTAEGNFALSVVERAKKLYLFEADKSWISALEKTFAPWKDKVVIINKYVSDNNSDTTVCLDDYFKGIDISFIKIDVEGAEIKVLNGGRKLSSAQKKIKIAVCTYHRQNDAEEINKMLKADDFVTEFSKGYMLFKLDSEFTAPYLRRGLIRAVKQ